MNHGRVLQDLQAVKLFSKQQSNSFTGEKADLVAQMDQMKSQAEMRTAESAKQLDGLAAEHSARKVPLICC